MKPTLYTQCVVTVIATCLVWLCIQGYVKPQPVRADGPVEVVIKGIDLGLLQPCDAPCRNQRQRDAPGSD